MNATQRPLAVVLVVAALVLSAGCYTVDANLPGTLRDDVTAEQTEALGPVNIEKSHWFFLWGLVGKPPADFFSKDLKQQVHAKGGDGVRGLTYESQSSCGDVAIGFFTGGCIAPRSYKMTGSIVRIRAARLPGKPAKLVDDQRPEDATRVAQQY